VARRAVNLHGCALPHCAPLLRRLRRILLLCPPFFLLRGYPGSAKLVSGRAPSVLSSRYAAVFVKRTIKVLPPGGGIGSPARIPAVAAPRGKRAG
jgi:hypothetical protein